MIASQNFHLGMLGHGTALAGADKDIAAMTGPRQTWATNRAYFSLPRYLNSEVEGVRRDLQKVDRADGSIDSQWRGHGFGRIDGTPAYAAWQRRTMEAIISRERFGVDEITDLMYINFKAPDAAGHQWNMIAPEQRDVLLSVDRAVAETVGFLDRRVGRENYVLVITADHGQTPLDGSGWPIKQNELRDDIEARFDRIDNGVGIVERPSTAIYFMNPVEMRSNGVSPEMVASFISRYTIGDNVSAGSELPEPFRARRGEKVFAAAIPGWQMRRLGRCADTP
jgi:predicted AlkP superfamily pyrophosphatase or phosphodiesterase